ncbi:MAG TPA: glycosyltransferase family 2 protein [Flavobacteriaceae bacterium]|nr:glycosyltransferase family 2 protein [Flavobacteriaceae bacterium]
MKLSIIILNYKVPYHLLLCLQSVEKAIQNLNAEIIVVDNHSEDETAKLVKKHFPRIILFQNEQNEGFSKGNNKGIQIAKGEYICVLNPDTVVSERVFQNVLKFAENHLNFGAIGVKMIDGTGNFLPESKRNLPIPRVAFQKLLGNTKNYYATHLTENETGKATILPGAFMFMKKARYEEVGGLDETYFMYGEDIDLSYKFTQAGYENYYVGSESILHFKGESTVKNSEYLQRFYGAMRLFHQKHFPSNFATDLLVKYGLEAAKLSNRIKSKNKKRVFKKSKNLFWATNFETLLPEKFLQKTGLEPVILSPEKLSQQKIEDALIVFDTESFSFEKILEFMQDIKNHGNRFRIKSGDFIIGSDSSSEKGEVVFYRLKSIS